MIVGGKTFERGEQCLAQGRVLGVESVVGELAGIVRPVEAGRAPYEVRIWVREDGLAYECTCPVGTARQFCKHAVAIALAHLERVEHEAIVMFDRVAKTLMEMPRELLLRKLAERARTDEHLRAVLVELAQ